MINILFGKPTWQPGEYVKDLLYCNNCGYSFGLASHHKNSLRLFLFKKIKIRCRTCQYVHVLSKYDIKLYSEGSNVYRQRK